MLRSASIAPPPSVHVPSADARIDPPDNGNANPRVQRLLSFDVPSFVGGRNDLHCKIRAYPKISAIRNWSGHSVPGDKPNIGGYDGVGIRFEVESALSNGERPKFVGTHEDEKCPVYVAQYDV